MSDGLAEKELRERYQVDSTVTYDGGLVVLHLSPEAFEHLLDGGSAHDECISYEAHEADMAIAEEIGNEAGIEQGYQDAVDDISDLHDDVYQAGYDDALDDIAALAEEAPKPDE
jgi:hypothetical protein